MDLYENNGIEYNPITNQRKNDSNVFFLINIIIGVIFIFFSVISMQASLLNVVVFFNMVRILPFAYIACFIFFSFRGEIKSKKKYFIWWLIIIVLLIAIDMFYLVNPSNKYGKVDYIEIENNQIPTLYKYTKYDDIFASIYQKDLSDSNIVVTFITIYYKSKIPDNYVEEYKEKLIELGYNCVEYQGEELYVKDNDRKSSFQYIFIGDLQVKYGICKSGYYKNVLK